MILEVEISKKIESNITKTYEKDCYEEDFYYYKCSD